MVMQPEKVTVFVYKWRFQKKSRVMPGAIGNHRTARNRNRNRNELYTMWAGFCLLYTAVDFTINYTRYFHLAVTCQTGLCIMINSEGHLTRSKFRQPMFRSTAGTIFGLPGAPFGSPDKGLQTGMEGVQRSEQWIKSRSEYFGASSPCAAYGVFDVRADLTQGMPGDFPTALMDMAAGLQGRDGTGALATCGPPAPLRPPPPAGVAMKKGTELEDQVAALFEATFRVPTIPGGVYVVPGEVPIRVSLDRTTVTGFPVELKSSLRPPFGSVIEAPPFYYVMQCLMQAMAIGAPGALLVMAYIDCPEYERFAEEEAKDPHPMRASVSDVAAMCELWRRQKATEIECQGGIPGEGFADTIQVFSIARTSESDELLHTLYANAWGLVKDISAQQRDKPFTYEVVKARWKDVVAANGGEERAKAIAAACTSSGLSEEARLQCFRDPKTVQISICNPLRYAPFSVQLGGLLDAVDS
jgi:hypothetical protein